jgi:predicted ATPase
VETEPESPDAAIAQRICGTTRWYEGNFTEARRHLEQALAICDAVGDRELVFPFGQDVASSSMVYLAMALWPLGVLDPANSLVETAVTRAVATGHIPTIAYLYAHAVFFEMMRRDRLRTAPHVQALLGLAREHGLPMWIAYGTFDEGWLRWDAVAPEAGKAEMHEGVALLRSQQAGVFLPLLMTLLAETEAEAGSPDAALTIIDTQLASVERTGQRWYLSELHRVRGEILLKSLPSEAVAAEAAFMRAIEVGRSQEAKLFELQAAMSLARLWRDQGRRSEARDLLGPIYNWFTEGFDAPDLKEAKALLDELP